MVIPPNPVSPLNDLRVHTPHGYDPNDQPSLESDSDLGWVPSGARKQLGDNSEACLSCPEYRFNETALGLK